MQARLVSALERADTKHRGDGSIYLKLVVCGCQGHQNFESTKGTTRTGCNACIPFSVSKQGVWTVQQIVVDHNHYLASPNKKHKLRSQRRVEEADKKLISRMREGGMKTTQVFEFMVQFYGGADKVPFSRVDCNSEIGRQRNPMMHRHCCNI
jgi:hypothetical protein